METTKAKMKEDIMWQREVVKENEGKWGYLKAHGYGTYFPFAEEDSHIHDDAEEEWRKGLRIGGRLKISLGMIFFYLCHTFYFLLKEVEDLCKWGVWLVVLCYTWGKW